MSELTTAARPYARAAFAAASKGGDQEQWSSMLMLMAGVASDASMKAVLDSPKLTSEQAADMFISVCKDKVNANGENFIKLLAENGRLTLLPEVAALFQFYRAQAEGTVEAELISAQAVSEAQAEAISASLAKRLGKKVSLKTSIDETLIGGAIVRAGDLVIDGSLRGRVSKLSSALTN